MKITIYELMGLIKDGKAPKNIKVTGHIYEFDEDLDMYLTNESRQNCRTVLGGVTGEINLIANIFNEIVEILPEEQEENDEWEDIEFENYCLIFSEDDIDSSFRNFSRAIIYNKELIEKLIKNQKYLKEKLENKNE